MLCKLSHAQLAGTTLPSAGLNPAAQKYSWLSNPNEKMESALWNGVRRTEFTPYNQHVVDTNVFAKLLSYKPPLTKSHVGLTFVVLDFLSESEVLPHLKVSLNCRKAQRNTAITSHLT